METVSVTPPTIFALEKEIVDGYEIMTKPGSPAKLKRQQSSYQARQHEGKDGSMDIKTKYYHDYAASVGSQEGKSFAITGCSTGTGYTLACTLLQKRAQLYVLNRPSGRHDNTMAKFHELAEQHHAPTPVSIPCDLTLFASVRDAGAALASHCAATGLDALVNNAGVMGFADEATADGELQPHTATTLHVHCRRVAAPHAASAH